MVRAINCSPFPTCSIPPSCNCPQSRGPHLDPSSTVPPSITVYLGMPQNHPRLVNLSCSPPNVGLRDSKKPPLLILSNPHDHLRAAKPMLSTQKKVLMELTQLCSLEQSVQQLGPVPQAQGVFSTIAQPPSEKSGNRVTLWSSKRFHLGEREAMLTP